MEAVSGVSCCQLRATALTTHHSPVTTQRLIRLISYATADGPHNMAVDEVLLESAAAGTASLRFYAWEQATVSLGYFQQERVRRDDPLLAGLPFVRRPSGGATLVHHHEVTYCLALPPSAAWQGGASWLCRMHTLVAEALGGFGIAGKLHTPRGDEARAGALCFRHFTAGDLLIGVAKVVGSAQRKYRGALMQHGSILLAQSPYTPSLPGIRELTGRTITTEEVSSAVLNRLTEHTGWQLEPEELSATERASVVDRATQKYSQPGWNCKR